MLKKYTSSYEVVLCWQQIVLFMEKLRNVRKRKLVQHVISKASTLLKTVQWLKNSERGILWPWAACTNMSEEWSSSNAKPGDNNASYM